MLLCVSSDGNNSESFIAKRFGHSNYLIIYDTETKKYEAQIYIHGGHNHDNLQKYLEKGVKVFIVGNIGPNAFEILKSAEGRIYLARKLTVVEAVELYSKGKLSELLEPTISRSIGK